MDRPRSENAAEEPENDSVDYREALRSLAENFSGSLIVEHGLSETQNQTRATGFSNGAYGIMQRIKQQLDPDNIFPSLPSY
jgi:FAD/FMN-containing dehydrogenase